VRNRGIGRARMFFGGLMLFATVIAWAVGLWMSPHSPQAAPGVEHVRTTVTTFVGKAAVGTLILCALSGWLLFPTMKAAPDPVASAVGRLRIAQYGGPVLSAEQLEAMLNRFGYAEVRSLPTPPTSPIAMVVGRRLA